MLNLAETLFKQPVLGVLFMVIKPLAILSQANNMTELLEAKSNLNACTARYKINGEGRKGSKPSYMYYCYEGK